MTRHSTSKTNRKPAECEHCGRWLKAGEGRLYFCCEDSGCRKHHDYSGYHVYCLEHVGCAERRAERRKAAAESKQRHEAATAALQAAIDMLQPVESTPEWVAGAEAVATWANPAMVHTGAYPTLYLAETEAYYYVPGYFACDWDYPPVRRSATITPEQREQLLAAIEAGRAAGIIRRGEKK